MMPKAMYLASRRTQREYLRTAIFRKVQAGIAMGCTPVEFLGVALAEQMHGDNQMEANGQNRLVALDDIQHAVLGIEENSDFYVCVDRLNLFTTFDLAVIQNALHYDSYMSDKKFPSAITALADYYHWKEKQDFSQPLLSDFIYRLWILERFATAYPSLAIRDDDYLQDWAVGKGIESPSFTLSANLSGLNIPAFALRVIRQGEKADDVERALEVLVDYYCK